MKPPHNHSPGGTRGVCCDVAAFAAVRLPYDALPDLRRNPEPVFGPGLAPAFFKHLDEQTVAGLAAVLRAVRETGLAPPGGFRDWGVLAAPHFLGQSLMVSSLLRFRAEGAWGVSPHVIPHHSLHSVSGTVSQVLKIHGPNLGVGGGTGGTAEALLAAAAWLGRHRVPGAWVVVTTLDPPVALGDEGQVPPGTDCVGLALALTPARVESAGLRLRFLPGSDARGAERPLDIGRLLAALERGRTEQGTGSLVVSAGAPRLEVEWGRRGRPLPARGLLFNAARAVAAPIASGAETKR